MARAGICKARQIRIRARAERLRGWKLQCPQCKNAGGVMGDWQWIVCNDSKVSAAVFCVLLVLAELC
eukprot:565362-Rhodomonas_salina.1